ncbi:hypothetical protein QFC20_007079 [Naganishia adeliensis]|uniref:Uncharacterized protein n=1 Tax=Naganishia adeliensis TaxID=92952 RepID=A0ACC2V3B6_9TREE|nr:hypothetical protein QFC20_007079 [Naganishia adeliensis]
MPSASSNGPPAGPPLRFEASKGPWIFSMWVEVDGEPMPVYHIEYTKEGPEAWIPVPEGKVGALRSDDDQVALALIIIHASQEYVVKQNTRKKDPDTVVPDAESIQHPDFEVTCCVDGDMVDVQLSRLGQLQQSDGASATYEGRQLPRKRMRRLMFSKPQYTNAKTPKDKLDRLGTIEVAWQRCDARYGEEFVNKEKLPSKLVNESAAKKASIDRVTSYGAVEASTKTASNVCGTIHPDDADDYMSMQFRYVSESALVALGYKPANTPVVASSARLPPLPASSSPAAAVPKNSGRPVPSTSSPAVPNAWNRNAASNKNVASSRDVASNRNVTSNRDGASTSARQRQREEIEVESVDDGLDQGHDTDIATAVKETKEMSVAISTMNTALQYKVKKVQDGPTSAIPAGLAEIQDMSLAINTMCSALQDKLRKLSDSDDAPEGSGMFKEVEDMNSAIRVMNSALQEKVKELRAGRASEHPAGLEELQAMSTAVHTMNDALQGKLKKQLVPRRGKPSSDSAVEDDKGDVRRSTAKRRKIV